MNNEFAADEQPTAAAICHDGRIDLDDLLVAFVERQRYTGRRVLGLVMKHRDRGDGCKAAMVLTDIDTGEEFLVSQALGPESTSCSADPQGFARASRVLRDAVDREPDLVICNRFGSLEAANGGFVAELLALLERGIPVLTVVAPAHADAWQRFVGEAPLLPVDPVAWTAWLDAVLLHRGRAAEKSAGAAPDRAADVRPAFGIDKRRRPLSDRFRG
jgi:nucleoside-triphosphatase THEP1